MPRVSICIPSYNHAAYLRETLDSALAQTERDIEVIVVDDRSTDASIEICKSITDARFRYIINDQRRGLSANFNQCLKLARGEYVKVLCDDDVLEEDAIQTLADALDRYPEASIAASDRCFLFPSGKKKRIGIRGDAQVYDARDICSRSMLCFNVLGEPSAVLLRSTSIPPSGFQENLAQMVDWDLWLRMLSCGKVAYVHRALTTYRVHAATASSSHFNEARAARDLLIMSSRFDNGNYPPIGRFEVVRLRLLCLLRGAAGAAQALITRNKKGFYACLGIVHDAVVALCT